SARAERRAAAASPAAAAVAAPPVPDNGHVELQRDLQLQIPTNELLRARRVSVNLRLEDEDRNVVGTLQRGYPLDEHPDLTELLLRLNVSVTPSGRDPR
ncbi:MAG: hypothetical protein R3190_08480, partial [Thermoanaerobaculia bacterium]|nr:hypothetical protein [Thermoanaerobaculia bacterium]